jgi:hypothetical protein
MNTSQPDDEWFAPVSEQSGNRIDEIRAVADLLANRAPGVVNPADHLCAAGKIGQVG